MTNIFKRIDTVFVKVKNLEEASKWYQEVLGLSIAWEDASGYYIAFSVGETALTLIRVPEGEELQASEDCHFNFYVSDANEACEYLKGKGVATSEIGVDGSLKWFSFRDIEGNKLEVCSF